MEYIFLGLIFYFFIGALVCLLICVNPNDPGILGRMSHFLFKTFPPIFKYPPIIITATLSPNYSDNVHSPV
jgi:hypothetical protein